MAGERNTQPRTVLESLLRQRDQTYEEVADDFERLARKLGEHGASISARHLRRLASGERTGTTPTTRRVLQAMFGRSMDELLQPIPSDGTPAQLDSTALSSTHVQKEALGRAALRARSFGLAAHPGIGSEAMEQVVSDVHQLASDYPRLPLAQVLGRLIETQELIFSLLEGKLKPEYARDLYLLGGVIGGLLANASHDLADPHTAFTQARTAFICADQAEHNGLRAWIRGMQSLIAYRAAQPEEAVRYAQSGAHFAKAARNTTSVWLPSNEARAWALLGNAPRVRAAIDEAERAWDKVRPDDVDELGGCCTNGRPIQLYYSADALAFLPDESAAAERYSLQAVEAYQDPAAPDWDFGCAACSHIDLAIARIRRDEPEGAREALAPILKLDPERRINGVIQSIQRAHTALTSSRAVAGNREIQEQLEAFTMLPARMQSD
jgi:hypothetical protein